jgi:hypothetical protein
MKYLDGFLAWLKSVFSETDGRGSCARVLSAGLAVAVCVWVTHIVRVTHALPPLGDATTLILAPYGANKVLTKAAETVVGMMGNK